MAPRTQLLNLGISAILQKALLKEVIVSIVTQGPSSAKITEASRSRGLDRRRVERLLREKLNRLAGSEDVG